MYTLSDDGYRTLPGYQRTFEPGHMTLGLFFPIEAFEGDTPRMQNQVKLARQAEEAGFAALWVRDQRWRPCPQARGC